MSKHLTYFRQFSKISKNGEADPSFIKGLESFMDFVGSTSKSGEVRIHVNNIFVVDVSTREVLHNEEKYLFRRFATLRFSVTSLPSLLFELGTDILSPAKLPLRQRRLVFAFRSVDIELQQSLPLKNLVPLLCFQ